MNYEEEKKKLVEAGFHGFVTIGELMTSIGLVPAKRGVYVVLRVNDEKPEFLLRGTGGFFKGKKPDVNLDELERNWVSGTSIVYIGKAGGSNSSATLQGRLGQYMQFGQGKNVGHYGGRYIWQLSDAKDLVVCWNEFLDEEPRDIERQMIKTFREEHCNQRPFANLTD